MFESLVEGEDVLKQMVGIGDEANRADRRPSHVSKEEWEKIEVFSKCPLTSFSRVDPPHTRRVGPGKGLDYSPQAHSRCEHSP